jgi:membrane protease YdiL (CAAX protease family)
MPTDPVQLFLAAFELTLWFAGAGLLFTIAFNARRRQRWLHTHVLPHWNLSLAEFALFVLVISAGGFLLSTVVSLGFGKAIAASPHKAGLQVFAYGTGMHGGFLLGWLLFPLVRRSFYSDYGRGPTPTRQAPPVEPLNLVRYGAGTLLAALPLIGVISIGWTQLLRLTGLPDEPQDLVAIFNETKSAPVIAGMLLVACVLAPMSEELVFRAGLYRFIRQKLGRTPALLISGACFGALHGNYAGFLPLAVLGILFAVVYEATGSIRVTMIAHALFNLNTLLLLLSGIMGPNS